MSRIIKFIESRFFWLHWVFIAACELSLVEASRGCSLAVVHRLLTAAPSLVAEQFPGVWPSAVVAHGFVPLRRVVSSGAEIESVSPALAGGFLRAVPPGTSLQTILISEKKQGANLKWFATGG